MRAVARALDKALAGEPYSVAHHTGSDYDPARCDDCTPDRWVVYAIGIAIPDATVADFEFAEGLHGLSPEDVERELSHARSEGVSPDVLNAWLKLCDRQYEEEMQLRAETEPGWVKAEYAWGHRWERYDARPATSAGVDELKRRHALETDAFVRAHSADRQVLKAAPELIQELRAGEPRKARQQMRAAFRAGKGVEASWLL